ncbi:hypothetical protein AAFF_G00162930 [Aldrovandia affinis]|uniref:Uncharacterized protein n=1 Tax=Aldrovandia affinis TaxID=143900 RepID=A0AAD7SZ76_9TELE|nr:hypothetical protein AAFF_G00162930 [Aldrovandia affinis]
MTANARRISQKEATDSSPNKRACPTPGAERRPPLMTAGSSASPFISPSRTFKDCTRPGIPEGIVSFGHSVSYCRGVKKYAFGD